MSTCNGPEWLVCWLLRISGGAQALAVLAIGLPTAWMAWGHAALGLGEFADAPLTQYLTRSISALYALHGGTLLLASTDVRRFAPLITYLGWGGLVFGLVMLAIDLAAGMPWYWTALEGGPIAGLGAALLVCNARAQASRTGEPAATDGRR